MRIKKEKTMCQNCGVFEVYSKGLCSACYQRARRNGTPEYKVCNKTETARIGREKRKKKALNKYKPTTEKGKYILSRRKQGVSIQDLTQELNVSRQTIYNLLKK